MSLDKLGPLRPRTGQNGWLLRPLRSRNGVSQLGIPNLDKNLSSLGLGRLRSLLCIQAGDTFDKPPLDGSTGGTLWAHPGLSLGETHLG